ncbi:MAG TPA: protein kinase [Gaiellaceae bacterium]|nr:protein kinase [Gaiellaceae bacterium]
MAGDLLAERYELEELVGSGGMSSVYRARDRLLERTVALKVLHRRLAAEADYVERFRREARMVAGLLHQNIVTVIDRGEDDGLPFIVFEYVAGESLKQLVQREGPLPLDRAVELGIQVARGLAFAHEHGYVHRDVKPQNVLLNGDGEAKVTDFGIARPLDVERGMTQTGAVLGTSDYIAPEQAQGRRVGEHTDVYSLGVVLYELLTGAVPFTGDNFVAVAMKHINEPAPRVSERRPDAPARLDAAVARALEKRPEDRFATMAAFAAELEACLAELRGLTGEATVVLPRPRRAPRRRRRTPVAALVLAAGLAVAVAALAVALLRDGGPSPGSAGGGGEAPVALSGVTAYDPYGDGSEHDGDARFATDGNPSTYWETQSYRSSLAALGKRGVGLVLDAGRPVTLHRVTVASTTPGFTARIQTGDGATGPFRDVSPPRTVGSQTTFDLSDARGRYVVVWISDLGPNSRVLVNEVRAS